MTGTDGAPGIRSRLEMATRSLACAPQAQRRYAQLGMLQRAFDALDLETSELRRFRDEGAISDEELAGLEELQVRLEEIAGGGEALGDLEGVESRDFLFSDALENATWVAARKAARRCFTLLKQPTPKVEA